MKLDRRVALPALLALLAHSPVAEAQARRIVLRAPSRMFSLACAPAMGSQTFSFSHDEWYAAARASLRDPINFGPTGTARIEFVFGPPYDTFNPQELDGADVLVLNPYSATPQGSELRVFGVYARGGVGFVSFQNAAATFFADAGPCVGDNTATFATAAGNPVLTGPFGAVTSPFFTGYNCSFAAPDPLAFVISNNDVGPNALGIDLAPRFRGAARAVSFGDEELFGNLSLPGCGSAGLSRGSNNDTLLRNVFAWVGATAGDPIPSMVEGTGDLDHDGITDDLDGDTDNDGILDLFEAGDTDPLTAPVDTDHDGTADYRDTDADDDGIMDTFEGGTGLLEAPRDSDSDGTADFQDRDSDNDGVPDLTEGGSSDSDGDGIPDFREADSDNDAVLDATDNCRRRANPTQTDGDGDGVGDTCDNCPTLANPEQFDLDNNNIGDACELRDGGSEASMPDAQVVDTGVMTDAGPALADARIDTAAVDAGGDAGTGSSGGACGCRVPGSDSTRPQRLFALGLVIGVALRMARRSRGRLR